MSKVLSIIKIAVRNPIRFLLNLNLRNIRTLFYALQNEDQDIISANLQRLIEVEPNKEIIQSKVQHISHKAPQVQHIPQALSKVEKEFWEMIFLQR